MFFFPLSNRSCSHSKVIEEPVSRLFFRRMEDSSSIQIREQTGTQYKCVMCREAGITEWKYRTTVRTVGCYDPGYTYITSTLPEEV